MRRQQRRQVSASDLTTELEMRIAVALSMTAGSTGLMGGTIKGLNRIHEAHKAELACGHLTEAQYAKKASELLNILRNFDGLIASDIATGVH
jgi:hypothetical protein